MLEDIKAVIFDLDGTLIDSMWVWKKVDEDYLGKRDIEVPLNLNREIEGLSFTDTAKYFKDRFGIEDEIDDIINEWHSMVEDYYKNIIQLKPGAFEFLEFIKNKGLKIGLATSNSRELSCAVLKRTGIYDFFDTIVTTCEAGRDKSFPDVFIKAAMELNAKPSQCLVFEDTTTGVSGAKKANMKVVAVYDEHSLPFEDEIKNIADKYIVNFKEMM